MTICFDQLISATNGCRISGLNPNRSLDRYQSAQQSNEICSESNDRLGLKLTRDFAGQKEGNLEILDRSEKQLIGDRRD